MPAPLPAAVVVAAREELLRCRYEERRAVLHRLGPEGRLQVVLALLEAGFSHRHSDAKEGLRVAQLAYQCSYRYLCLPAGLRPAGRQVRAAALGFLANAYRIQGHLRQAERCWARVRRLAAGRGELPPALRARLLDLEASLARGRRHFQRAVDLLERADALAANHCRPREHGSLLLNASTTLYDMGRREEALCTLARALHQLGQGLDAPITGLGALHSLVYQLTEVEQTPRAAHLFAGHWWLYFRIPVPILRLRARWVLGRILRELGDPATAASHFEVVRDVFVERELFYEASLIGLELALAYSLQHQSSKVLKLAQEMLPVFRAQAIPREASMVLLEFVDAAQNFQAEAEVITGALCRLRELGQRDLQHRDRTGESTQLSA